jgi:hypothetical protein
MGSPELIKRYAILASGVVRLRTAEMLFGEAIRAKSTPGPCRGQEHSEVGIVDTN